MPINAGACLHLSTDSRRHLWVVLTEPEGDPLRVALVNLTSHKPGIDETVILEGGHSYIKHKTVVQYARAKVYEVWKLERIIAADLTVRHRHDMPEDLLKIIREGVAKSRFTPPKVKAFCQGKF